MTLKRNVFSLLMVSFILLILKIAKCVQLVKPSKNFLDVQRLFYPNTDLSYYQKRNICITYVNFYAAPKCLAKHLCFPSSVFKKTTCLHELQLVAALK